MDAPVRRPSTLAVVTRFAVVEAGVLALCWWIFLGSFTGGEAIVGGLSVATGTAVSTAAYLVGVARFRPRFFWIAQLWRVPWYVLADTGVIANAFFTRELLRKRQHSRFVAVPFRGGGSTGRGEARRAIAIVFTTLAPNSVVLDIDRDRRLMILHQMRPAPLRRLLRRLGAGGRSHEHERRRS